MSYLVLARKWRPKTFQDIIGQEYITTTLRNALSSGKLAHALIFSGPRGIGKTSTARIVAKALNCENKSDNYLMCEDDFCTFCAEISEGKSIDVQEIDAASHTGVNDVREIIENVKYLPSSAKNKVYIIDEAHMLSQAAFNALLKTLEEPPGHVLFILATTEPHKIPSTILSRCQRYDFRKVSVTEIKKNLERIIDEEKIKIDEKSLFLISREADGSVRDSLSLMDQLIATFGNNIKSDEVISILGIVDNYVLKSLLKVIIEKDPKNSLKILNDSLSKGLNPKKIAEDLTKLLRHVIMLKICGDEIVTEFPSEEKKELLDLVSNESTESLELLFNLMLENSEKVQKSSFPEMSLESMIIKLSVVDKTVPINKILEKLDNLKKNIDVENSEVENSIPEIPNQKKTDENEQSRNNDKKNISSETFVNYVSQKSGIMGVHLESASSINFEEGKISIIFNENSINYESLNTNKSLKSLEELANNILGEEVKIELLCLNTKEINNVEKKQNTNEKKDKIKESPLVKNALDIFDGRILKTKATKKE